MKMDSSQYWNEITGIGKLYIDIDLVTGYEPVLDKAILFVCTVDENPNEKYLVMTYDPGNGIYVMRKIGNSELLDMLMNKVTMEETFRNGNSILKTFIGDSDILEYESFTPSEFDKNLLPQKGAFFEVKSECILKYMESLENKK